MMATNITVGCTHTAADADADDYADEAKYREANNQSNRAHFALFFGAARPADCTAKFTLADWHLDELAVGVHTPSDAGICQTLVVVVIVAVAVAVVAVAVVVVVAVIPSVGCLCHHDSTETN